MDEEMPLDRVGAVESEDDITAELDAFALKLKGKKKRRKRSVAKHAAEPQDAGTTYPYSYEYLLSRVTGRLPEEKCPAAPIPAPLVGYLGSTKTLWTNFEPTCAALGREAEHVRAFFSAELGAPTSTDKRGRLVIKGRHQKADVTVRAILRKYHWTYVSCSTCKTRETDFVRDPATRLSYVECRRCKARRAAPPIDRLFRAKTRADRRAAAKKDV